jgi:hypothetical protein
MVLVLVLSVLTISYASSLKAYFQQHSPIAQLRSQIASSESTSSTPTAWWTTEWRSVELAGNPPEAKQKNKPLKYLGGR